MGYTLTPRLKIPVPEKNDGDWLEYMNHWAELIDVMLTVMANQDYVISGLSITTSVDSLDFTYSSGVVSINGSDVNITGGSGVLIADKFNWVYVQSGQVKVSIYPPSGTPFVPLASVQTDSTGAVGPADLRISPPGVNGVSIAPFQVNPTGDINLATGKLVKHAASTIGNNIVMFSNDEISSVVNWGNRTSANDWQQIDISTLVPSTAKLAILNMRLATLNAETTGWAVLEVRTESSDTEHLFFVCDYGHGSAVTLNPSVWGPNKQIMLRLSSDKKFWVRTRINNLGGTGAYYAFVQLLGYVA